MPFQIMMRSEAARQFQALAARDRGILQTAIDAKLTSQPAQETKAVKRLRRNPVSEFELRIGNFRVLYDVDVDENLVKIVLVGEKRGNTLFVEGQAYHDHESQDVE